VAAALVASLAAGIWSARRGTYRVLYRVHDDPREVVVLRIEHRGEVYRPR
jgi:mRNA interferase RelE/StbE